VVLMAAFAGVTAACSGDGDEVAGASTMSTSAALVATSTPTLSQPQGPAHIVGSKFGPARGRGHGHQGQVQTANDRVELPSGEAAWLVVTSDVEDELHVHGGIGFEAEPPADMPTTLDVNFEEPGVYYIELHHSGLQLLQFGVQ
jgi:hypothetical protein